ncbi:MAG: PKD domain-containing protein [Methanospirillaceae archaeon]|nr:PKD domain-containing protein [Methanospirillaceae archaeon]
MKPVISSFIVALLILAGILLLVYGGASDDDSKYEICLEKAEQKTPGSSSLTSLHLPDLPQLQTGPAARVVGRYIVSKTDPYKGEAPLKVHIWDESLANKEVEPVGWKWDLGDGEVSEERDLYHTYEEPGEYTIIPSVLWSDGQLQEGKKIVIPVYEPKVSSTASLTAGPSKTEKTSLVPVSDESHQVAINVFPSEGFAPLEVDFSDDSERVTSLAVTNRLWEFGDGTTSSDASGIHRYVLPGDYTITLTVAFEDFVVRTGTTSLSVRAKEQVQQSVLPTPRKPVATPAMPKPTPSSGQQTPVIPELTPPTPQQTTSEHQEPEKEPSSGFCSARPRQGPVPLEVLFEIAPPQREAIPVRFDGKIDGVSVSDDDRFTRIFTTPGRYLWTGTVSYSDGTIETDTGTILAEEPLDVENYIGWLVPDSNRGVFPLTVEFTDLSYQTSDKEPETTTIDFDDGDSPASGERKISHTYDYPGIYYPRHTVIFDDGVALEGYLYVLVDSTPLYYPQIYADTLSGPAPLKVTFEDISYATGGPFVTDQHWEFDDGTIEYKKKITHTFSEPGVYEVFLFVTYSDDHEEYTSVPVTVFEREPEEIYTIHYCMELAGPTVGHAPLTVYLQDRSYTNNASVVSVTSTWDAGDGTPTHTGDLVRHEYTKDGIYDITHTVTFSDGYETNGEIIRIYVLKSGAREESFVSR